MNAFLKATVYFVLFAAFVCGLTILLNMGTKRFGFGHMLIGMGIFCGLVVWATIWSVVARF